MYKDNSKINAADTRLLTICGTYRRPAIFMRMLDSWRQTKSNGSALIAYLSDDDPSLTEYVKLFDADGTINYVIGPHRWFPQVLNYVIFGMYPRMPYYSAINDDHIYHTPAWDALMIAGLEKKNGGWGWVFANDMIDNGQINTHYNASAEMFTWKFVDTVGYAYPPDIRQFGADVWAQKFLRALGKYTYMPDVKIEHRCGYALKQDIDENYRNTYSTIEAEHGYAVADRWMAEQAPAVIARINERMRAEKCA